MSLDKESTHGTCPKCGHNGCYTEWPNGSGYCHSSCGPIHSTKTPSKPEDTTEGTPKVEVNYIEDTQEHRGITKRVHGKYGVSTSINPATKEEERRVYPYPHKDKYRYLPKDFSKNSGFSNDHLFGMDKFNAGSSKFITVVEGEEDAMSAYQMLGCSAPVVSLPSASISKNLLVNCSAYLDSFESIIVATDNDKAGDKAAERLALAFPNKVYRVPMTLHKDANAYLTNGAEKDFKYSWINRKKYVPEFDTSTPDDYVTLLREAKDDEYIPTGIQEYDENNLGLFQGHFTVFQAPEGTGKTELFHYLEHRMIKEYPDIPFATCHLEESKKRTALSWVSYELDDNVTRQDLITDVAKVEKTIKDLTKGEQVHLFQLGTDEDPTVILDRIKYYAEVCECKYIFIEPIQDLAQQYSGSESTERFLSRIAVNLARIANEKNVGIVAIAHENDDGLISDCRKLSKQASVVVRLERDMTNSDEDIRNTTTLTTKKNRPTGYTGYSGRLKFNSRSFTLEEE